MEEGVEWEVAEVVAEVVEEVVEEVVAEVAEEVAEEVVEKSVGVAEVLWKKEKHNILELEVNDEPLLIHPWFIKNTKNTVEIIYN